MQAADEACRHLLPAAGMGDPNATMDPALADQMLKFAQCMRDHGVDFPDPVFSGGGMSIQVGGAEAGGIDPTSKVFQAAQEACAKEPARRRLRSSMRRVELRRRPRHPGESVRGLLIAGAGLALVVGAGAIGVASGALPGLASGGAMTPSPSAAPAADLTTAPVERRTMETAADLSGSLAYEASRPVAAGSAGTVTRLPAEGAVIERGGVLYELDGRVRPRLLYGDRPLWRRLGPKVSDGADVLQLEQNLKAMGYAPKGMKVNRHWDARTTTAVKRWQKATGRKQDATLDGADLAFLPGAVRVASTEAGVGAAVAPGAPVLGTTTATRVVTLDLSASRQDLVAPGQAVTIDLPDGSLVPGHVRSIGRVATAGENGAAGDRPGDHRHRPGGDPARPRRRARDGARRDREPPGRAGGPGQRAGRAARGRLRRGGGGRRRDAPVRGREDGPVRGRQGRGGRRRHRGR